jgi:hypothetical protein
MNLDVEPTHPDGLWADLRQLCEDAGWEISRLQLEWRKEQRAQAQRRESQAMRDIPREIPRDIPERRPEDIRVQRPQGQRLEGAGMREAPEPLPEDTRAQGGPARGLEDMGSIADQAFGENEL